MACTGLVQWLQGKWQHLQRAVPGTSDAFAPPEDAISWIFLLPAPLEEPSENLAPMQALFALSPINLCTGS
jgi:hypothetical protein